MKLTKAKRERMLALTTWTKIGTQSSAGEAWRPVAGAPITVSDAAYYSRKGLLLVASKNTETGAALFVKASELLNA